MMKKEIKSLVRKLESVKKELAKDRDALRDILNEYQEIFDSADDAQRALEEAIDDLSQYL